MLVPEAANYEDYVHSDLRVGIIGFGKMGILHGAILNLLKPSCVTAIVDKNRFLTFGASTFVRIPKFYTDLDKMMAKENLNVIYVTTPARSHFAVVSRLLDIGIRYVFVEKPPTLNSSQIVSLIDKMASDQVVMAGLQKRFAPACVQWGEGGQPLQQAL